MGKGGGRGEKEWEWVKMCEEDRWGNRETVTMGNDCNTRQEVVVAETQAGEAIAIGMTQVMGVMGMTRDGAEMVDITRMAGMG